MGGKSRRKTRKIRGGAAAEAADAKKPQPICQCTNAGTGKGCNKIVQDESLFCEEHQDCPKPPLSGYEPEYEPKRWNEDPAVTKSHNCYNYFANYMNPNSVEECRKKVSKDAVRCLHNQEDSTVIETRSMRKNAVFVLSLKNL